MNRQLLKRRWLGVPLLSVLVSACGHDGFPTVPTPTATSATVLQGSKYQGNMTLATGSTTSFNMTLIARGLAGGTAVTAAPLAAGTLSVTGNFETGTGLTGTVQGTLVGTLDDGTFQGSLSADSAGHTAAGPPDRTPERCASRLYGERSRP